MADTGEVIYPTTCALYFNLMHKFIWLPFYVEFRLRMLKNRREQSAIHKTICTICRRDQQQHRSASEYFVFCSLFQ